VAAPLSADTSASLTSAHRRSITCRTKQSSDARQVGGVLEVRDEGELWGVPEFHGASGGTFGEVAAMLKGLGNSISPASACSVWSARAHALRQGLARQSGWRGRVRFCASHLLVPSQSI